MLSPEEIYRYKRHLLLKEIGGQGQQKLKAARVLVIGAGGLGSPLLMYLAAAGVGHIGIIDHDHVSLDNLQRQIVHATANVGALKTDSAAEALRRLNPHVELELMPFRLDATTRGAGGFGSTGIDAKVDGVGGIAFRVEGAETGGVHG